MASSKKVLENEISELEDRGEYYKGYWYQYKDAYKETM